MGIFQSWQAVNAYIDALSRYGIDTTRTSADLSSRVCKIACAARGADRTDNYLHWNIQRAAALVALCMLGPHRFAQFQYGRHDISEETITQAAASFKMGNDHAASVDLQIIYAVAASGSMSRSFTLLFAKLLAEEA